MQLTPQLCGIQAVLCDFLSAQEEHGNIVAVEEAKFLRPVHVHFTQPRPRCGQQRFERGLHFVAQMASRPRVEREVQRPRKRESARLRAPEDVFARFRHDQLFSGQFRQQAAADFRAKRAVSRQGVLQGSPGQHGGTGVVELLQCGAGIRIHGEQILYCCARGCQPATPRAICSPRRLPDMYRVLALVDDLFFQAKILAAARQSGVELICCTTAEALLEQARVSAPALLVVDLNARADALGAIRQFSSGNCAPVVAFLSHVQTGLAEEARRAGCAEVMPRSQFSRDLPAILARAKTAV